MSTLVQSYEHPEPQKVDVSNPGTTSTSLRVALDINAANA